MATTDKMGDPSAATAGNMEHPVANVDDIKARWASKEAGKPWSQPLLNPFANPVGCLIGYCCGPCQYGFNAAAIGEHDNWILPCLLVYISSTCCLGWYFMQPTRSKIRHKYGLEEAPYSDCMTSSLLCCFGICQEAAEIEYQLKNPSGPTDATMPPPSQTM